MKSRNKAIAKQITKQESDILYELIKKPYINQRILSESSGHSLGVVNSSLRKLKDQGYLDDNFFLTEKSKKLLKDQSPKNAIILAAGVGMRMVPINMTTPKALLEINGERLIDRLIIQLHEIGIMDITIVVGFMKDSFEYLIDEYGVKLAYAPNYASTNNLHSLAMVVDKISNTYVIPCDIWCDKNPFQRYELYSWYMVNDMVDEASDVRINRKMELVKTSNNNSGNGMIGICFLTNGEADIVRIRIKELVKDPSYNNSFWEEALYSSDRMIVQAKVVDATDVVEINTYEQLREIDSDSNQLRSDALEIISNELECKMADIIDIEVLKKGMTNRSFIFKVRKGYDTVKYIMRIPGEGTDILIDRAAEALVYKTIKGLGLCDDPIYINPINGYKISKYIEGARCCDIEDGNDLRQCMKKLRDFHNYRTSEGRVLTVNHTFNLFERIDFYESLWGGNPSIYHDYVKTKENCRKLIPYIEKYREIMQLTHIDAIPDNFLFDSEGNIQLTDWEYAGMQDRHVDIAMFCIYAMYDKNKIDNLIDLYFEDDGGCTAEIRAKIYAYISVCGLLWSNWCEYKRNLGVEFGEYSLRQYRFAKEYYNYAIKEFGIDKEE